MTHQTKEIIQIYSGYGFEHRQDLSASNAMVFTITQGVFDNAIILTLSDDTNSENLANELSDLGFQVKKERFVSLKNTENSLFSGFFSVKKTKAGFKRDYDSHIRNVINSFPSKGVEYYYIRSPFSKNASTFSDDADILSDIQSELKTTGPKLIHIEAAAGFGKTCTAYEVGKMISERDDEHIVLFAELSRDRHAKIFNHVLHKEVARSFPTVSPDLIIKQIKNGKVIVILDGFDELLNDREEDKFQFEKSQAMLETIGKILELDAKVILTTRKTAILQGDDFDEWIGQHAENFAFTRYSLKEPSIRSWLSYERHEKLESSRINIKNLSNPVLLTFLKYITDEQFDEVLSNPDGVVDKYFDLLMTREIERQTLELTISEQSDFMKRLAQHMMSYNFTRDSKENIIQYFSESEISLIEESRSRYSADVRPTFEEMLEKLSNHALLDRSSTDEKIGFINNFVLGHFVAMDLINTQDEEWVADNIFLEAAVNAYSSRTLSSRLAAWEKLTESLKYVNDDERIRLELRLLDRATGTFSNSQFSAILFDTDNFFIDGSITSCYFNECTFKDCTFDFTKIKSCTFISCSFYNCSSTGENSSNEFISSHMDETSQKSIIKKPQNNEPISKENIKNNQIKAYILEKFWPVGKETVAFAHRPMLIFYRGGAYSPHEITEALDELRRDGLIVSAQRKNWVGLELSGTKFIAVKEILGR
jgi:hypothetical protein